MQHVQAIVEPEARAAYLWVIGEYGAQIQVSTPCHAASSATVLCRAASRCPSKMAS